MPVPSLAGKPLEFSQHRSTHVTAQRKGGSRNFGPLCLARKNAIKLKSRVTQQSGLKFQSFSKFVSFLKRMKCIASLSVKVDLTV